MDRRELRQIPETGEYHVYENSTHLLTTYQLTQVDLVGKTYREGHSTYSALLVEFLWSTARNKQDALDYLVHLDATAPWPVLSDELRCPVRQQDFIAEQFTQAELSESSRLEEAAYAVLDPASSEGEFASSLELLAAGLSATNAFRAPIRIEHVGYRGGKPKPDCVEVAVREVMELLLYDARSQLFDVSLLPPSTKPSIAAFFSSLNQRIARGEVYGLDASEVGSLWFIVDEPSSMLPQISH